jgi:hypothetical protein
MIRYLASPFQCYILMQSKLGMSAKLPSNGLSITRVVRQRLVIPMVCGKCSHSWDYTGKNQYVATCPICRSKLSIRKNNVKSLQPAHRIETPVQAAPADMVDSYSSNINNRNPIWKKAIRIGSAVVAPIPESLVKELHIEEEYTWFEVSSTSEGIFLRIASKRIGSEDIDRKTEPRENEQK